jgi:hypothetical protein
MNDPRDIIPFLTPLAPFSAPNLEPGPRGGALVPQGPLRSPSGGRVDVAVPAAFRGFLPHQYARITDMPNQVLPASGSAALFLLEPTTFRNLLAIRNTNASGGVNVLVGFGAAPSTGATIRIEPGQVLIWDAVVPQDDIWLMSDGAAGTVSLAFSTMPQFP